MRSDLISLLAFLVNWSLSSGYPLKRVVFPSDNDDSGERFFNEYSSEESSSTEEDYLEYLKPKAKFRINAANVTCANSSVRFCEKVSEHIYPSQHVKSVLEKSGDQYMDFFNKIEMRVNFPDPCKRIVYPQIAMNVDSDWRFIINQPGYVQQIRIGSCQQRSSQCQSGSYISSCKQKFEKIPLLSLDDNGDISQYEYEFPSHCQCDFQPRKPHKMKKVREHPRFGDKLRTSRNVMKKRLTFSRRYKSHSYRE